MQYQYLIHLLNERNWRIRLWLGGALYDTSMRMDQVPPPVLEIRYCDRASSKDF